jgi:hypothetical protein
MWDKKKSNPSTSEEQKEHEVGKIFKERVA